MLLQKERQVAMYHTHVAQFMGAYIFIWVLACFLMQQSFIRHFASVCMYVYAEA